MTQQGSGDPDGPEVHPAPAVRTSTNGPKALTFVGTGCVVLAVALVCLVAFGFTWDRSVLARDGSAGPGVTAVVDTPGEATFTVDTSERQRLYLAFPTGDPEPALAGAIVVLDPTGAVVTVGVPDGGSPVSAGGTTAHLVGLFGPTVAGTYRIEAPATLDGSAATVLVQPSTGDTAALGQAVIAAVVIPVAIGLGGVGAVLAVWGALWWRRRAQVTTDDRRTAGADG